MSETAKPSNEGSGTKKYKEIGTQDVDNEVIEKRIDESIFYDLRFNASVYHVTTNIKSISNSDQTGASATDNNGGSVVKPDDLASIRLEDAIRDQGVLIFPFPHITSKENANRRNAKNKEESKLSKDNGRDAE